MVESRIRQCVIEDRVINDTSDCFVVAEIGHNHQGSLKQARELFRVARECGADAVKLQKRDNSSLYTRAMYDKPYDHENSFGATYGEHREALEFGQAEYADLQAYARELGLTMFATVFDRRSADFLAGLDMPAYKIASGDLKNIALLEYVARLGKPMIVSTGGATIEDVQRAHDTIMPLNSALCLLQCTAVYPAAAEELNLRVITSYRERFPDVVVGLSDHENGIAMATAAYVLGARIVEKHFTLNHTLKGTDHAFSLEPIGMRKLVRDLRRVRVALGNGVKQPYESEGPAMMKMGKKLVAARNMAAGHILSGDDLSIKSPGGGIDPSELPRLIGRKLRRSLCDDEELSLEDLMPPSDVPDTETATVRAERRLVG